jgi:arylsulfatase A-like enzyme
MASQAHQNSVGVGALVGSALGWSLSAALGWSFFDADILAEGPGISYAEALVAAVAAGAQVALAALPLALVVGWLCHNSAVGRRLQRRLRLKPASSGATVLVVTLGWLMLSYATYATLSFVRHLFASEQVHQLALSGAVPAYALGVVVLGRLAHKPLRERLDRIGGARALQVAAAATLVLAAGWVVSMIALGEAVYSELSVRSYVPVLLITTVAVLGAVLAPLRRARLVVMAVALLALPPVAMHIFGQTSKELRMALAYQETGTSFVNGLYRSTQHSFSAADANEGRSAVCFPDVEAPTLSDVGKIDEQAPDIIWLTIDAVRWDRTSLSGYERDTTPNIARHAERAAVFEQAYTPATTTRQTLRSLFSGVYPSMINPPPGKKWALTFPDEQHTLAEFLSAAGYHTTVFSAEKDIFSPEGGALKGFDVIDESAVEYKREAGYMAPQTVDDIIDGLEGASGPQFMWTHLIEPHEPYRTGPDALEYGDTEADRYDAAIRFVDGEVDRLLEFVQSRQSSRPTYVFLSADHGEAFGEHNNRRHGSTIYQEEVHVPLIVWGPDVQPARFAEPTSLMDIFPTTFDVAGLDTPPGACGASLAGAMRGDEQLDGRPVYAEQIPDRSRPFFLVAFIQGSDKLMLQPNADAVSLFDLADDPGERRDLAAEQPDRLRANREALLEYWRERGMDPADYGLDDRGSAGQ